MRQFVTDSYSGVMNARCNPFRNIPDHDIRNAIMLGLMFMWCSIFAVWTAALVFLGASIFFPALLFFGVLVMVGSFELAKRDVTN